MVWCAHPVLEGREGVIHTILLVRMRRGRKVMLTLSWPASAWIYKKRHES